MFVFGLLCVLLLNGQFSFARPSSENKDSYTKMDLSPEDAERLASWTEDSNENIWELSGQFEGDMVLSTHQRNGLLDTNTRWLNQEIPYEFDTVFSKEQQEWITYSLNEYYKKTCIKPRLRLDTDEDYVYITGEDTGCHSAVGRRGGQQIINLQLNEVGSGCLRSGTIVHEFFHALGFYHQQSASDRDEFVQIVWENIKDGKSSNFKRYPDSVVTDFDETYDYDSVMHYSAYAFTKNGQKTILTKDPEATIGQRKGLSESDAIKINKMYECDPAYYKTF